MRLRRISPRHRTFYELPIDSDRRYYRSGADLYSSVTGIAVYVLHDPTRLGDSGDVKEHQDIRRWANFNETPYTDLRQKNYAVWIEDKGGENETLGTPGHENDIRRSPTAAL